MARARTNTKLLRSSPNPATTTMSTQNTTTRTRAAAKRKRSVLSATVDKENDPTVDEEERHRVKSVFDENAQLRAGVARIAELEAENAQLRASLEAATARLLEHQQSGAASSTGTADLDNAQLQQALALASDGVPVLREALEAGNGAVVTCLLGQAPGAAALVAMCLEGRAEIVKQLLAAGANADLASVVEEEVERGPSYNRKVVKEAMTYTPLLATAKGGHAAATAALLEAGAVVDGAAGTAALLAACRGGHTEIVKQLTAAGAAAGAEGEVNGERCPAVGDKVVILRGPYAGAIAAITTVSRLEWRHRDWSGCARVGVFDLVVVEDSVRGISCGHVEPGSSIKSVRGTQMALVTPLYAAAAGGRAGAVAALLEAGATVRGEAATAALVWACSRGHVEVVTLLAAAGASVNGRDKNRFVRQWKNGNGIVNTASSTSFFARRGYDNKGFETPLHAAVHAMHDTVDTVVALLDAGAALDADAAKPIKLPLLKALLKKKGLRTGGTKPVLVERLREALL